MADWYYSDGDNRKGPVSKPELLKLIADGKIRNSDYVWNDEMDDWKPVFSIPELNTKPRKSSDSEQDRDSPDRRENKSSRGRASRTERSKSIWQQQGSDEERRRKNRRRRDDYDDDSEDDYDDDADFEERGRRRRRRRRQGRGYPPERLIIVVLLTIFGILLSWACCGLVGFSLNVPAVLLAKNDLRSVDRESSGLAITSLVIGIIGLVLSTVALIIQTILFFVAFSEGLNQ